MQHGCKKAEFSSGVAHFGLVYSAVLFIIGQFSISLCEAGVCFIHVCFMVLGVC